MKKIWVGFLIVFAFVVCGLVFRMFLSPQSTHATVELHDELANVTEIHIVDSSGSTPVAPVKIKGNDAKELIRLLEVNEKPGAFTQNYTEYSLKFFNGKTLVADAELTESNSLVIHRNKTYRDMVLLPNSAKRLRSYLEAH